ncbi:unnamed protein product [Paramecium sonneborni]|uniref:G domain-containing protein n=1 Tax=Paramecium sonneborni TaxID=65129 RepID=A0A8S1PUX5_9CILI|nr:unnamed protein product [Paramecium sonneborni]
MGGCYSNNNKNQDETSIIVFFFLIKENFDKLKKNLEGLCDISVNQVSIFSTLQINQQKIFISNGQNLSSKEEFDLYLQSCNLEGDLKQIFVMIDLETQRQFYKTKFFEFICQNEDYAAFITFILLINYYYNEIPVEVSNNLRNFGNIIPFELKPNSKDELLKLQNFQKGPNIKFDYQIPQFKDHRIFVEKYHQYLDQLHNTLSFQNQHVKQIDELYQLLIKIRNQSLYECSKQEDGKMSIHWNAISLKFNSQILDLIDDFTNAILDKIGNLQEKFKQLIVCCKQCKSIFFCQQQEDNNRILSQFYNTFQKRCSKCKVPYEQNQKEVNSKHNFKLQLLKIQPISKKLNLIIEKIPSNKDKRTIQKYQNEEQKSINQVILDTKQKDNQQLEITQSEDQEKQIILIGKSGVGKTIIFNKLCDCVQKSQRNLDKSQVKKSKCKNNLFSVIDTPSFELKNEEQQLDQEQIEYFGKIIVSRKINQIFIVTNHDRIETMKKKIMDCFKYLHKFKSKISIIIMNLNTNMDETNIQSDLTELQQAFQVQKWLHFNLNDEENCFIEQITTSIESTSQDFLDTQNTFFDRAKMKLTESQFQQNLEQIKYKKLLAQKQEELEKIKYRKIQKQELQKKNKKKIEELTSYMDYLFQELNKIQKQFDLNFQQKKIIDQDNFQVTQEISESEQQIFQLTYEIQQIEMKTRQY